MAEVVPLRPAAPKRRPGAQPGHGAQGGRPHNRTTLATRHIAEKWIAAGKPLPLDVMLENMFFYHEEVDRLMEQVGLWKKPPKNDVERKDRMHLIKAIMGARSNAEACACDAAPYMHPQLKSVDMKANDGRPFIIRFERGDEKL